MNEFKYSDFQENQKEFNPSAGKHYRTKNGKQSLELFEELLSNEEFIGAIKFNLLKYSQRFDKKNQATSDLNKIIDYATFMRDLINKKESYSRLRDGEIRGGRLIE
ncbi:MAG: DUF3310 domain-containing protein [Methanobrevibacter sp.]|jgi:hypothetical protein|nr:DUF3310 domain-containing protein [Methanobrevibacter sp.]